MFSAIITQHPSSLLNLGLNLKPSSPKKFFALLRFLVAKLINICLFIAVSLARWMLIEGANSFNHLKGSYIYMSSISTQAHGKKHNLFLIQSVKAFLGFAAQEIWDRYQHIFNMWKESTK